MKNALFVPSIVFCMLSGFNAVAAPITCYLIRGCEVLTQETQDTDKIDRITLNADAFKGEAYFTPEGILVAQITNTKTGQISSASHGPSSFVDLSLSSGDNFVELYCEILPATVK